MKPMTHNTARRTGYTSLGREKSIGGHQRQRGSLLILCVTVLVIIALIGIAFLQRVRLDQAATARHERNYMDLVINGILSDIGNQLTDDIFDNTPTGKELYDYPWTKDVKQVDAFFINGNKVPLKVNGSGKDNGTGLFLSDHEDDRWLASSAPVFDPNNPNPIKYNWLHLTNLTGIWLDLENPVDPEEPIDAPINQFFGSDTDIALADLERIAPGRTIPLGVDADLDGIMDSRWQWVPVPVRDFAGRKYVMAVRIVDLNSMLNVNTATPAMSDGISQDLGARRGYAPTGADLSRFFKLVDYNNDNRLINNTTFPGDGVREAQKLLDRRSLQQTSTPLLASPPPLPLSAFQNKTLWENQASIYGNLDRNYLSDSEMDLRRFGGINDFSIESPLEFAMPKLLRQGPEFKQFRGTEASYVDLVDPAGTLSKNARISRWFLGTNPSNTNDPDTNRVPVKDRKFPAIRHWLTTASGVGAYVTKYGATNIDPLKFDVKQQFANTTKLRERLQQAFRLPNPTAPNSNWYLGIADPRAQADLIDEYVVAIQDYSDANNIPTARNGFYGMERLPFLREVYVQALYADVLGDTSDRAPWDAGYDSSMPGTNYVGLQYDPVAVGGDTRAMVIELGNPFSHRINGTNTLDPVSNQVEQNGLDGRIRIVVRQGGTTTTWMFGDPAVTPIPDINARDSASAGDTLLIFSPPVDKIAETGGTHDGSDLLGDVGVVSGVQRLELPPGTLTVNFTPNGGTITVELDVLTSDGTWVTYDRLETDPATDLPINDNHPPTSAPANNQFAQASFARNSQNINFVVDDGVPAGDSQTNLPSSGSYSTGTDRLGNDSKGSASISPYGGIYSNFFNRLQLPIANQPMRSTAELAWVHMFGFTSSQTFSERMSASGPVGLPANEHFLLIDPRDPGFKVLPSPPIGAGISHAAILMNLFTTVSPRNDGWDNDNNDGDDIIDRETSPVNTPDEKSIDNTTEQFIPGTINVNTAPLHILTLGAPLAESIDDTEQLMRTIISYRDQPRRPAYDDPATPFADQNIRLMINPVTGINRPIKPGIGSIGELLYLNPYGLGAPSANNLYNMQRYGMDGSTSLPSKVDLYPDPNENGSVVVPLGDDNEQKLARFQMLGQTFTVRSDRFVVYAVVRGYDWAPGSGPIHGAPAETAQFIAIFDRGAMKDKNDTPRVIGYVRLQ